MPPCFYLLISTLTTACGGFFWTKLGGGAYNGYNPWLTFNYLRKRY